MEFKSCSGPQAPSLTVQLDGKELSSSWEACTMRNGHVCLVKPRQKQELMVTSVCF